VRHAGSDRCACGLVLDSREGHAYNEEAFRYLLTIQHERSERSDRPFVLLLIDLSEPAAFGSRIDSGVARTLFSAMCRTLRETDVIGWYREGRIAGAVLTELGNGSRIQASQLVAQRLTDVLRACLPTSISHRLQVRACQLQPKLTS
jgi:hypothetical protein